MKKVELKDMEKGKNYAIHNSGVYKLLDAEELEVGKEYTWKDENLDWPLSECKSIYLGDYKFQITEANANCKMDEIITINDNGLGFPFLIKL